MTKGEKGLSAFQLTMMALGTVIGGSFLVSSGGFALLFTYAVIMATQIRFRKKCECPPHGKCQMPGYPFTSWIVLIAIVTAIFSMPLIPRQGTGLITGICIVALYSSIYLVMRHKRKLSGTGEAPTINQSYRTGFATEFSQELGSDKQQQDKGE